MTDITPRSIPVQSLDEWPRRLSLCGVLIVAALLLFHETLASMVAIWWRSETYAHGFFILPVSLYLIWRKRALLSELRPRVDLRVLPLLALLGFVWLLGNISTVMIVQQFVLVALLPALVWLLLGAQVVRAWAFPLAFLVFAVPFGEALIPILMHYTASFTVMALKLSRIPVYWEGFHISLPNGEWSVAAACSGIRYLIASLTTGLLFAYLSYHTLWRRLAFVLLSIIFPIVANWLRAYMIVMIGYFSNMRLAVGIDHIIYGWIFFGIVMLLMFRIGSLWREPVVEHRPVLSAQTGDNGPGRSRLAAVAALLLLAIWPAWSAQIMSRVAAPIPVSYLHAPELPGWQMRTEPVTEWQPRFLGPGATVAQVYARGSQLVGLRVLYYSREAQGAELINSQNVLITEKDPDWHEVDDGETTISIPGLSQVTATRLRGEAQVLAIWQWYYVDGVFTDNTYVAKLLESRAHLLGRMTPSAAIFVYATVGEYPAMTQIALRDFTAALLPSLSVDWSVGQ